MSAVHWEMGAEGDEAGCADKRGLSQGEDPEGGGRHCGVLSRGGPGSDLGFSRIPLAAGWKLGWKGGR